MQFDRRYWPLIGAALIFASIASAATWYLAVINPDFRECNSVSASCFSFLGMVPCMVFGILALVPLMIAIPYLLGQYEHAGSASVLLMGLIVLYTALDAINNVSAILGYYEAYNLAHLVLTTTNNVTGDVVGTGSSHC